MTRQQAKALAKRQRRKGVKLEEYKCDCGAWHIGSPTFALKSPGKVNPTDERLAKGTFKKIGGKAASERYLIDVSAHPIDALQHTGQINADQAGAGRMFEELDRAATEVPGTRDSTTIWEPKGHSSDDGNIKAVRRRRELYLFLGVVRDRLLRRACVEHDPRGDVGALREALNEAARFFGRGLT
jgi:hypothetical protein